MKCLLFFFIKIKLDYMQIVLEMMTVTNSEYERW